MLSPEWLSWLPGNEQIIAMMARNWMIGVLVVAGIVFLETGLVVFPFLPGDSLLFATGAFLGISGGSPAAAILIIGLAAVLGDGVNYLIGRSALGQQLIRRGWAKPYHVDKTRRYFDRFGGATITIGRFIPIVRTAAPFLAGLTGMCPRRFALYNVAGAAIWCNSLMLAGYWLGGLVWVREHMSWLSMGIIGVSLLPMLFQWRRGTLAKGG